MGEEDMRERRQFVRLDARIPVTYRVLPTDAPQQSTTKNISEGGICVFVNEALPNGTAVEVTIKLPDQPQPITVTGAIVWCEEFTNAKRTSQERVIQAGVKFVYANPKDQEILRRHILSSLQPPPLT